MITKLIFEEGVAYPKQSQFYTKLYPSDSIRENQEYAMEKRFRSGSNSEDCIPYMEPKFLEKVSALQQQSQQLSPNDRKMTLVGSAVFDSERVNENDSSQKIRDILFAQQGLQRVGSLENFKPIAKLPSLILKNHDHSARSNNRSLGLTLSQTKSVERLNGDTTQFGHEGLKVKALYPN